jgi:hypothetical protein
MVLFMVLGFLTWSVSIPPNLSCVKKPTEEKSAFPPQQCDESGKSNTNWQEQRQKNRVKRSEDGGQGMEVTGLSGPWGKIAEKIKGGCILNRKLLCLL